MAGFDYDIGIIGGGAAGLTVAAGASRLGAKRYWWKGRRARDPFGRPIGLRQKMGDRNRIKGVPASAATPDPLLAWLPSGLTQKDASVRKRPA